MAANLQIFRQFYNQVRPHANLGGRTPAEAWSGRRHNLMGKGYYVNEWDGVLKGIYLPPKPTGEGTTAETPSRAQSVHGPL